MSVESKQSSISTREREVLFLSRRLCGLAGDNGISSDAMIASAMTGSVVPKNRYPHDTGDLARCLQAYHEAPNSLRRKMMPILADFVEHIGADLRERVGAYQETK